MWYNGAFEGGEVELERGACGYPTISLLSCTSNVKGTFSCHLIGVGGTVGCVPCTFLILRYVEFIVGANLINQRSTLELDDFGGIAGEVVNGSTNNDGSVKVGTAGVGLEPS